MKFIKNKSSLKSRTMQMLIWANFMKICYPFLIYAGDNNLEEIILGIYFTKSNEWTGMW